MATYLINSARISTSGTVGDDLFTIESGAQRPTLYGNDGNDTFRLLNGASNSGLNFGGAVMNGQVGNDIFVGVLHTGLDWIGNFFGGGQGNDLLMFTAENGSSADFVGNTLQGGQGNDTLKFAAYGIGIDGLTMNGNEGSDYISFSASASGTTFLDSRDVFLAGGKGNDQIMYSYNAYSAGGQHNQLDGITIAGGQGSDRMHIDFYYTANDLLVYGDSFNTTNGASDGDDDIWLSGYSINSATIIAGGGDDYVGMNVYYTAENLKVDLGRGDDTFVYSGHGGTLDNFTIDAGAGDDFVNIRNSGGVFSQTGGGGEILLGAGNDTFIIQSSIDAFTSFYANNVTLEGGAGADLFMSVSSNGAQIASGGQDTSNPISGGIFRYASLSDSTIDAMDTIVVGTSGGSGLFELLMPVAVNVFNGVAGGYSFSAGMLEFGTGAASGANSGFPIRLNQIVGTLDATLETGDAVAFKLQSGDGSVTVTSTNDNPAGYVFVKGKGDDDLLVKFDEIDGGAFTAGEADGFLRNNGAYKLTLKISD